MKRNKVNRRGQEMARALGWFSIGLGVTELILGGRLSKPLGLGDIGTARIVRAMGLREIAQGIFVLSNLDSPTPMWVRVAGDVVDLGGLWSGMTTPSNPHRGRVALAMGAVAGITALDIMTAKELERAA